MSTIMKEIIKAVDDLQQTLERLIKTANDALRISNTSDELTNFKGWILHRSLRIRDLAKSLDEIIKDAIKLELYMQSKKNENLK